MKTIVVNTLLIVVFVGASFAQTTTGANVVQGLTAQVDSNSIIDATVFTGAPDICKQINNAITSVSAGPVTIDARGFTGSKTCSSNPFAGAGAYTGRLLLGGVTITTTVGWSMPQQYFWIEGIAEANMSGALGTIIKASGSSWSSCTGGTPMTAGCPVIFIGTKTVTALGTGVRNVAVDCNSLSGCIGIGSVNVQEGGGLDTVTLLNQTTECVDFDTAEATSGVGISNSFLRNVDCNFITSAPNTAIGIYVNAQDGPAEISNTTVAVPNSNSSNPIILDCLDLDGGRGTNINFFHCEHATNAEVIGDSTAIAHDITVNGLTASATEVGVLIKDTGDYDISIESVALVTGPSTAPVAVTDNVNGVSTTGMTVAKYVISTATSAGGALFTTDSGGSTVLGTATITTVKPNRVAFMTATLGALNLTPGAAGQIAYCSDCQPASGASICAGSGGGALAVRQGPTGWYCK